MIAKYMGFEINVTRERALGGWYNLLYILVVRESDGLVMVDTFSEGADTVRDMVGYMKNRIDAELEDGWPDYA